MVRSLDHLIIGVRDLDAAARHFERMGFHLSPKMHHSIGTSNHLIMFGSTFLELVGGFERIDASAGFGRVSAMGRQVAIAEGVVGTAFASSDARGDQAALVAAGAAVGPVESFTRPVPLPSGEDGEVHCSVVMSDHPAPRINLFVSNQHRPQFVWIPEWQRQPNGVCDIVEVDYALRDPEAFSALFAAFVGTLPVVEDGLLFTTGRNEKLRLLDKGLGAESPEGAARIVVRVKDIERAQACLVHGGVEFLHSDGGLRVAATEACGLAIDFRQC